MSQFNRALILSASIGAGHLRAADALATAFKLRKVASEIRHVDSLQYSTGLLRAAYSKGYSYLARNWPALTGWLYEVMDHTQEDGRSLGTFERLNTRPLARLIRAYRPDVVVCTHFLPAAVLSEMSSAGLWRGLHAVVVTDCDVHAVWLCRNRPQYFVATDEARVHLEGMGVDAARVSATGIPIDPAFVEVAISKHVADRPYEGALRILVSGGRLRTERLHATLNALARLQRPTRVSVLCGASTERKEIVERMAGDVMHPQVSFATVTLDTAVTDLMADADFIIGRTGGLMTSEALASGLAFIVMDPIPGQEERNASYLLENGAAVRCYDPRLLPYKIERILDEPGRLDSMRARSLGLGRPDAAFRIIDRLQELADQAPTLPGSHEEPIGGHLSQ